MQAFTLGDSNGLRAEILPYGGVLRRLTFPSRGAVRDLVIPLPNLDAYVRDSTFQGVIAGRVANRIAGARFALGGRTWQLTANDGANHLHGGRLGFGKREWAVQAAPADTRGRLQLALRSPAGEEGYPGNLDVTAEFVVSHCVLRVSFEARTDAATPVALTWHPYFNLSGDVHRSADEMALRIPARSYLPVRDSQLIPTGAISPVANTPFDFLTSRPLKPAGQHLQLTFGGGYDHCWVLDNDRDCDAELHSPHSGITMKVRSNLPGLQFYGGQHLSSAYPGLHGVCLEPQQFPNAVNEPAFPSCILQAGDVMRTWIEYELSADEARAP